MKDIGDLLVVVLLAAIVWGITLFLMMILTTNVLHTTAARPTSIALATVAAAGFVGFWIKGRSASNDKNRNSHQVALDLEVVRSYCALFEDLVTTSHIYDISLLPYPKEHILSAAIRVLERKDSPELFRAGAMFVTDLSLFQEGVGSTPHPTLRSLMIEAIPADGVDGVDQHFRAIANHTTSDIEARADREREKISSLVTDALNKAS